MAANNMQKEIFRFIEAQKQNEKRG